MGIELRVALFAGALFTLAYIVFQIRKSRLQIDYTIYWSVFSVLLLLLSIFPDIAMRVSGWLGVESPANLVYLAVIFVLLIKLFTTTIKLSKMNRQIVELTQHIALQEADDAAGTGWNGGAGANTQGCE